MQIVVARLHAIMYYPIALLAPMMIPPKLKTLRKQERDDVLALNPRFLTDIAEEAGVSITKVSRTFHSVTKRKDPRLVAIIERRLAEVAEASPN